MKNTIVLLLIIIITGCASKNNNVEEQAILKAMYDQQDAWNNADLEKYMEGYWKSDSLMFIGSKGIQYGWKATLKGYKRSYPNAEMMGKLTFSEINVDITSKNSAFVLGKWHLKRTNDELSGYYTLLWKKKNGQWKIIIDHSS